ncbi:MAG: hypothetical protein ACTTJ1_01805 [Treponema sp.]
MTELLKEVQQAAANELERINKTQLTFHSPHEAYAAIKEKYDGVSENVHHLESFIEEFWECVKDKNTACYADVVMTVKDSAIRCAVEAILVAIAAQKTIECIDKANTPTGEQ